MSVDVAPVSKGRLPNLVIIGVSKAGTTSLFNYLGEHPDICNSDVKELRYFTPLRYGKSLEPIDIYTSHFRQCEKQAYAVEATPGYFYGGHALAKGLRDTCPGVHALVSLRSPEERCWSWFRFVKSRLRIPKDMTIDEYLDRCEELRSVGKDGDPEHQAFWGLGGGCYAEWLEGWVNEFGDRFRILFFDDVVDDPRTTLTGICDWLSIDSGVVEDFRLNASNKTEQYQNQSLQRAAVTLNRRGERFFRRHQTTKRLLRRAYNSVNKAPSDNVALPEAARDRMAAFYRPHNLRLSQQLATLGLSVPADWSKPQ